MFRDGLRRLLESEPGFEVCGEASNGHEALQLVETQQPDLLLLDLSMPELPGLDVLGRLSTSAAPPKTVVLTAVTDPPQIIQAFQLGASGIVLKESATRVLFDCIRSVMSGGYWIGEQATKNVVESLKVLADFNLPGMLANNYGLTSREIQIVNALLIGSTNREIAAKLSISEQTVKNHLTNIFDKFGVTNRLELGLFAQSRKLNKAGPKS